MALSEKNLSANRQAFISQLEVGSNSTFPVYRSPQNKTSYVKKISITNHTGTNGSFDIGLYENSFISSGNVFVATSLGSTKAVSSTDGITWTTRTMPANASWRYALEYGNGVFVAAAYESTTAASSTDGITWTLRTMPANSNWYGIAYKAGTFIAISYGNTDVTTAASSTDGITWTLRTMPGGRWYSINASRDLFFAVGLNSTKCAYSTDGITWSISTLPTGTNNNRYQMTIYGNGMYVVGEYSSTAAYSTDAITWNKTTLPGTQFQQYRDMTYGNGTFVAVAAYTSTAASSTDGITWILRTMPSNTTWYSTSYGNGTFIALAAYTTTAASSADGITWTLRTLPVSASWWGSAYPQNSDFRNETYLYKSQTINANTTTSLNYEIIVPPTHEIRVRSTVPVQVTVQGDR